MTALRAVVLILLVLPSTAAAESVVVEPGDDLAAAFRQLAPGDELAFGPGTFTLATGLDASVDGNDTGRITIRGSGGTVIEAPEREVTMRLEGSHFTVQDLEINGPGDALVLSGEQIVVRDVLFRGAANGIVCEDCGAVTIRGCEFSALTDDNGAAIFSESFANGTIDGNWLHNGMGDGIVLSGSTMNAALTDNVVESFGGNGVHVVFPPELAAGQPNTLIGNFVAEVAGHGISTVGGAFVTTNIVTDFGGDGIVSLVMETMNDADVVVTHNTVVGTTTCFRASQWSLSSSANVVANNAFYCPDDIAFIFDDGVGMNTIVSSNIYVGVADFPGESTEGNGLSDFIDAGNNDFYPGEGSPLIDAGNAVYLTNLDFSGEQRDGSPDVGAYERAGNTNPAGAPGGDFKGGTGPGLPGGDTGVPESDSGGTSGGAMGGGTSGFPERDGCAGCASAGATTGFLPALFLLLAFIRRRR